MLVCVILTEIHRQSRGGARAGAEMSRGESDGQRGTLTGFLPPEEGEVPKGTAGQPTEAADDRSEGYRRQTTAGTGEQQGKWPALLEDIGTHLLKS